MMSIRLHSHSRQALLMLAIVAMLIASQGCRALKARHYSDDPLAARSFSHQGAELLEQRKFSDAETMFGEAIRQSPKDERAQWGMAEVLWQRGEHAAAIAHMSKAAELSGSNPDLLVRLGQMHLEQGNHHLALQQADAALRMQRSSAAAWCLKGDVLRTLNDRQQALDCYHRALMTKPDWPEVEVTVAELYQAMGYAPRALAALDRMNDQMGPGRSPPRADVLRGRALASLGAHEDAKLCLRQAAMRLGPEDSKLLLEIAQLQHELGDLVESRLCLGRSLERDPNNPAAAELQTRLDESFARLALTNMSVAPAAWNR